MGRYTGPVCRLCRAQGEKLFLKGERCMTPRCAIERRRGPPGDKSMMQRRRRISEHGAQLREKQKAPPHLRRVREAVQDLPGQGRPLPRCNRRCVDAVAGKAPGQRGLPPWFRGFQVSGTADRQTRPHQGERAKGNDPFVPGQPGRRGYVEGPVQGHGVVQDRFRRPGAEESPKLVEIESRQRVR